MCAYLYVSMDGGTDWFYFCICFLFFSLHNTTIFLKHKMFLQRRGHRHICRKTTLHMNEILCFLDIL